ncbi:cation transporter [Actinomyces bowdenii]|uniref:cation diffusion facilitator family transporter n=1 Tax=Actinomyces bowdenii TaxID=131109 RepID=UPI001ABC758C|nr:cation diffusion facilitator family transporter [Actinomyces bowdenii]MBO3725839.1 cation transporter [Actinomyces bowdenii]
MSASPCAPCPARPGGRATQCQGPAPAGATRRGPRDPHGGHGPHSHGGGGSPRRIGIALALTLSVMAAELVAAGLTGSLSLLADAGHMLTDSAGLVMALVAARLSTRPPTGRSTWGLRRAEVLGAAAQAGLLGAVGAIVAVRAVADLIDPPQVAPTGMLVMGAVGLAANAVGLLVLAPGRGSSLNARAAFLEVLNDALGSLGVIGAAVVVMTTGWARADAVAALIIAALIAPRALMLLREAASVLMERAPEELDLTRVRAHMLSVEHVEEVHDLHAWTVASGLPVLTAHVVVRDECLRDGHASQILHALQDCVGEHFPVRVEHATFQIEPAGHRAHEHLPH